MTVPQKYFEDFSVGDRFVSPSKTLTDAHFLMFSAVSGDTHPIHHDVEFAARHEFGRPVAHGLLLAALTALGASEVSAGVSETIVAFVEQSTKFTHPAFVGDTVTPLAEVAELSPVSGQRGLVRIRVQLINQDGRQLLTSWHSYLVRRAGPG